MNETIILPDSIKRSETPALPLVGVGHCASSEVYLMDCVEGLRHYPDNYFDLAIVDPPYGIMKNTNPVLRKAKMGKMDWDVIPDERYWLELWRVSRNVFVFGAQYFDLPKPKTVVFWDKQNHNPLYGDGELCFYFGSLKDMRTIKRNLGGVIKIVCSVRQEKIHPTQKPIQLYDKVFHYFSEKGQRVLDTHLGSGSSRIAANKAGLDFVGFELDEEYFKAQEKRWENWVSQTRMF